MTPPQTTPQKTSKETFSLVFFGTGPVSQASLESLASTFQIEAVITKPDSVSPSGRPLPPPVKVWTELRQLPLYQPANSDQLLDLFQTEHFSSPVGVVVDYGHIIPSAVIDSFPKGIVNSHFSLLPEWRGADPITAAILSGQDQTGVSLMLIVPKLDEGPLIAQEKYSLPANTTIIQLTQALIELSNKMLQTVLPRYLSSQISPWPQDPALPASYSRKLKKSDGLIDWAKPASQIEREIRAFLGWPGSKTSLFNKEVTITQAHIINLPPNLHLKVGDSVCLPNQQLGVMTGDDLLIIDHLKPSGKPVMSGSAFLSGIQPKPDSRHSS